MRIVSGKYKGRVLDGHHLKGTRPTMDRVKESLFAMIQTNLKDSFCLDLFAGSGNLGLEALSEGAAFCVFNDYKQEAITIILKNARKLNCLEQTEIYKKDFKELLVDLKKKFDIIFLDPPYQTNYIKEALELIEKHQLLKENGLVILESNEKEKFIYDKNYFEKIKERKYGDKYIEIIKKL